MPILRKQKVREYTTVDNRIINDASLSSRAKFMYVYMLSKPDDWKFNYKSFLKEIKEGKEYNIKSGESVDIPIQAKHSLQNPYDKELKILEVQKGNYISEDDIIRYEDCYGRL